MRSVVFNAAVLLFIGACLVRAQAQTESPSPWSNLHFRYIGPAGNRTDAIAGIPAEPLVYYAGAASGGVWKTTDGGVHWAPLFDAQDVQSIGALAVAPSDPNIVWAGTGEPYIRSNISIGDGNLPVCDDQCVVKVIDRGAHVAQRQTNAFPSPGCG